MNDLALGAIVLMVVAAPLALALLAAFEVIRVGAALRHRSLRVAAALAAIPAALWLGRAVWSGAGAAHLEPLCAAYATPQFYFPAAAGTRSLLIDASDNAPDSAPPAWAAALIVAGGPLESYEWQPLGHVQSVVQSAYALEVRHRIHHRNLWFTVEMERYRLLDRRYGTPIAEGDELRLQAGSRSWHCGIGSGRQVTEMSTHPHGDGVARFVQRAFRGSETISAVSRSDR
jgi:hypothetical protein